MSSTPFHEFLAGCSRVDPWPKGALEVRAVGGVRQCGARQVHQQRGHLVGSSTPSHMLFVIFVYALQLYNICHIYMHV